MNSVKTANELITDIERLIKMSRPGSPVYNSKVEEGRDKYKEAVSKVSREEDQIDIFEKLAQSSSTSLKEQRRFLYVSGRGALSASSNSGTAAQPTPKSKDFEVISQYIFKSLRKVQESSDIGELIQERERVSRGCGSQSREVAFVQRRIITTLLNDQGCDKNLLLENIDLYAGLDTVEFSNYRGENDERLLCHLSILNNTTRILEAGLTWEGGGLPRLETFMLFAYGPTMGSAVDEEFTDWFENNSSARSKNIFLLHQLDSLITLGFVSQSFAKVPFLLNLSLRDMPPSDEFKRRCISLYRSVDNGDLAEKKESFAKLQQLRYLPQVNNFRIENKSPIEIMRQVSHLWDRYFLGNSQVKDKFIERLKRLLEDSTIGGDFICNGQPKQAQKIMAQLLAFALNRKSIQYERQYSKSNVSIFLQALWEYPEDVFLHVNLRKSTVSTGDLRYMTGNEDKNLFSRRLGNQTAISGTKVIVVIRTNDLDKTIFKSEDIFSFEAPSAEEYLGRAITHYASHSHLPEYTFTDEGWKMFTNIHKDILDDKWATEAKIGEILNRLNHDSNRKDNKLKITETSNLF